MITLSVKRSHPERKNRKIEKTVMRTINLDIYFCSNPKVTDLANKTAGKGPLALIRLWCYTAMHHWRDGVLRRHTEDDIEKAIGWRGKRGTFVPMLLECGLMDEVTDSDGTKSFAVHDWQEHQAHLPRMRDLAKRASDARWERRGINAVPPPDPEPQQMQLAPKNAGRKKRDGYGDEV